MDAMLYVSTDGGAVWTEKDCHIGEGGCVLVHPESTDLVFAGGKGETSRYPMVVSYSTDGGNTWTLCQLSGINSGTARSLAVAPSQTSTIYAAGDINRSGSVHVSTDFGATWTETLTAPADSVTGLAVHPEHPDWVYAATRGGLFRTTDGGMTWQNLGAGDGLISVRFFPGSSDTLFVGGDTGVLMSEDQGGHWTLFNQGLGSARVNCLEFGASDQVRLYAGTEGQACFVYAFPTGVSGSGPNADFCAVRVLHARGILCLDGTTNAEMLDILGSRAAELRPGDNDISSLSPGVYIVRWADGKAAKVLLVR